VDVAKAPKGRGRFCPLAEANGNKTGSLFLKLTTLNCTLRYCWRRFAAINKEGLLLRQPPAGRVHIIHTSDHLKCTHSRWVVFNISCKFVKYLDEDD
jgi:hypothetical protein